MVRTLRVVPKEWTKYEPVGLVIPRTRFVVFKTPLNCDLLTKVPKLRRFNVNDLFRTFAERGQRLGMVVDLTDTDRYYDRRDIEGMCVEYAKVNCPGRGFIDREECVESFNQTIEKYISRCDDKEALIGVHCTHGVNRSGYLICRFLIERLGWSSHEAIDAFERARGHPIEKGNYIQEIHRAAKEFRERKERGDDGSDSERERRRRKERKRRQRDEQLVASQFGDIMQDFLGHFEQATAQQETGEGSGYGESPVVGTDGGEDSPLQQHWAYASKNKKRKSHAAAAAVQQAQAASSSQETEKEEDEEDDDTEDKDESLDGMKSSAAKRRERRERKQFMLRVMQRGNFHEIQAMQQEFIERENKKQYKGIGPHL